MKACRQDLSIPGAAERLALDAAARIIEEDISLITNVRATAAYQRSVSRVIVHDALATEWQRAREGSSA